MRIKIVLTIEKVYKSLEKIINLYLLNNIDLNGNLIQ